MSTVDRTISRVAGVLIAGSLIIVSACQQQAAPPPAASQVPSTNAPAKVAPAPKPDVYKIGHVTPLTGPSSELGNVFKNAADLAVELVNAQGGVEGVKMQMVTEDHQADPKLAIPAFSKIVNIEKAPVILSGWSSVVMALTPTAQELKTLLFNYAANTPTIRGSGQYTFSQIPLADVDVKLLAKFIYTEKNARKLAIIYVSNDTGRLPAAALKESFEKLGGQVVAFEAHEPDSPDFGAQLAKIKAANPDVIHIHSLHQDASRMVKQLRQMGMQQQLTSYSGLEAQTMFDVAGSAAEGLIYTTFAPPAERPEVQAFVEKYKAKYGKEPANLTYVLYIVDTIDTIMPETIKYLNKKGLAYTGENLRQAMVDIKEFNTPLTGKTSFQFPGQDVIKPVTLKIIDAKEKKFKTLKVFE